MALPALRYVDAFPVEHQGQQYICLRDPEGVVEGQIMLTPPAFFIACQLDGRTILSISSTLLPSNSVGMSCLRDDIHRIVTYLDENGFLQTARFVELQQRIVDEFTRSSGPTSIFGREIVSWRAGPAPCLSR